MASILPNHIISDSSDKSKMTDDGQELLSEEGSKVVSVRGSWTVPQGMYDDVKETASKNETAISDRQSSSRNREDSKETVCDKETLSESLHLGEDRRSLSVQDLIIGQTAGEENNRKHKSKQSRDHDGKRLRRQDDGDDERCHGDRDSHEQSHRHKDRRRSRSAEDRRHHHRSREEQVRGQRQRSRESQSKDLSPQRSLERNNENFCGKNESSAVRDKTANYTSNGRLSDSVSQSGFVRKPDRKDSEQEHSRRSILKSDYRERSPYRDSETQNARSDRYEETNNDQTHGKRRRSNSPERDKEVTYADRGLRSDRRHQKHRSRSQSRSRGRQDRYKDLSSHQRRRRSRSRSCDNGHSHNQSLSLLRNSDVEPKPKATDRRPQSKSREQESIPVEARANSTVDTQRRSGEKDRWRKRRSRSRSPAKRSYEDYSSRDHENRRSQSRDRIKNLPDDERQTDSDYPKRCRSKSRSVEHGWNSSNWEDRKRFREEFSQDGLPNSGVWSGYPERVTNNKYYHHGRGNRQNAWMKEEKEDNTILHDQSRDNVTPKRWRGNQDRIGTEDRPWDGDRKRDWDNYRHRRVNKEDPNAAIDSGQQLEDMVTKSLAKLRRDSDREHRGVDENVNDTLGGEEDKIPDKDRHWDEGDRSAIPVLLSKKSAYKSYDPPEAEDFNYDRAGKEDFCRESDLCNLQSHDPHQQGFPAPAKGRHLQVGQPRFHGDFREPPPRIRVDFPPRGKAMLQPPVAPGQFGIGARLMSGMVQLVAPIHLRPPPMAVDWRMMSQDAPGSGLFPISRPPPPPPQVGPRGQLIHVGGFIRTQVPVEFLARHPVRSGHLPGPLFQSGPPHSLPQVHPGTPSQPSLIRPPHLQCDPRQLPPPPITLLHSSHQLHLPHQEPPRGLVDIRNLGPQPSLHPPPGLVPPHPPPNLTIPPPPLPIRLVCHGQREGQSVGYPASNQTVDTMDTKSPSTPPPPPPPASSTPQDPRLYSIKLLSHKPMPMALVNQSSNSTSDESLDSETCFLHRQNESPAQLKPSTEPAWQQSKSPERPNSALSFGSDYTPQEITDDAYTEALFEEPYSFEERDASSVHKENLELKPRPEVSSDVPLPAAASTERMNVAEDEEFADVCSQAALEDETTPIPEIVNPMASPTVDERQACDQSPANAGSTDALAGAAQSLQMIQVADLKKVLETVRTTTTLSNEEEVKSQDKLSNRMDQIAEEVKLALKPHFAKSLINKDEYKDIMRKAVPKIFSSKSSLDRTRIQGFVQEYVSKIVRSRKPDKAKKLVSQGHGLPKHSSKALSKAV